MRRPALCYTGGCLDRAPLLRKDPARLDERLRRPGTRVVPVWRSRNLVTRAGGAARAVIRPRESAVELLRAAERTVFLGLEADEAVLAADLSPLAEERVAALLGDGELLDLRRVAPLLDPAEAALLAYARGILHWHRTHRHCGRCGHPTESREGGHLRVCTRAECAGEVHPRTDPAVIMLVEHRPADGSPPRCLLARHNRLPARVYTTLAGFVEPGETLEEAVRREVQEEVGLEVEAVGYQGSQPWPFPSQLMLGFRAWARSAALVPDRDEIREARWFGVEEVRAAGEWGDDAAGVQLPPRDSIARQLIEDWLADAERDGG